MAGDHDHDHDHGHNHGAGGGQFGLSEKEYDKLNSLLQKKSRTPQQNDKLRKLMKKANNWADKQDITRPYKTKPGSNTPNVDFYQEKPKKDKGSSTNKPTKNNKPTVWSEKRLSDFLSSGKLTSFTGKVDPAAYYGTKQVLKRFGDFFWQWGGHHAWRQPDGYNEHSAGRAVDLMIGDRYRERENIKTGNQVAKFLMTNANQLGLSSVIWRQRIWTRGSSQVHPSKWRMMGDRGSDNANHFNHLHISYIDNTKDFGGGKIKELNGKVSGGGGTGGGGSNGGSNGGTSDGFTDGSSGGSNMQVNQKPYRSGSARKSFANTLVARLGFTEEQARSLANMVKKAKTGDEAMGIVYGSDIYKERFIGNEKRKEAGLKPISESEYITLERNYAQTLQKEGIKEGLFDDNDFADWIANDISNLELTERVEQYRSVVDQWDDSMKDAMQTLYGMDKGDFLAFAMKPERGQLQKLEKKARALEIADAAIEEGFGKVLKQGKKAREWTERIATSGDENVNAEDVFESQRRWNESGSNDMQKALGFNKRSQRDQIEEAFGVEGGTGMSEDSRRLKMRKTMQARYRGSGGNGINMYEDDSFDSDF